MRGCIPSKHANVISRESGNWIFLLKSLLHWKSSRAAEDAEPLIVGHALWAIEQIEKRMEATNAGTTLGK